MMNKALTIRKETEKDYEAVEKMIREAFYNLYVPGCMEHYLAHVIRGHEDFIPELDLVLLDGEQIIGNIMYTKTRLVDEQGKEKKILTFGPVCIRPGYQRQGHGKRLMEYSFERAEALGYDVIVIFGNPGNYVGRGFKSCRKYNVCLEDGTWPASMLVKELREGALDGRKWIYYQSPAFEIDEDQAQRFDDGLERMEKRFSPARRNFISSATR